MKKTRVALGLAAVCALALSGCGANGQDEANKSSYEAPASLDALVKAAKEEGSLKVYSSLPEGDQKKLDEGFTEKYGIKVESLRLGGNTLPTRFESEIQAGTPTADAVLSTTLEFLKKETENKHLVAFDDSGVTDYLEGLPDEAKLKDYDNIPIFQVLSTGFIYNSNEVSEGDIPKSWEEFVKSDLLGKSCAVEPGTSESLMLFMASLQKDAGDDVLKQLGEGINRWYPSVVPMNEAVASGECAIGLNSAEFFSNALNAQGGKTGFAEAPTAVYPVVSIAVNESAESPNAARLYMQYALSQDGGSALQDPNIGAYGAYDTGNLPENFHVASPEEQKAALESAPEIQRELGF